MTPSTRTDVGIARDRALDWLLRRGYRHVATDLPVGRTRIPIVLTDGAMTVFVELKLHQPDSTGAVELVDPRRARNLVRAVGRYLAAHADVTQVRIDVVVATDGRDGSWKLEHYLSAVP